MRGERGEQRFAGLNELLRRMAKEREELLSQYQLGDVMADIREELDDIVNTERRALERHIAGVSRDAAQQDEQLRNMASDIAAKRQATARSPTSRCRRQDPRPVRLRLHGP